MDYENGFDNLKKTVEWINGITHLKNKYEVRKQELISEINSSYKKRDYIALQEKILELENIILKKQKHSLTGGAS